MLDRSEISNFLAATNFQFTGLSKLNDSITQLRDSIFDAMATARGLSGVNGVVMFGDWVVFMLKHRECISHSRWRQLLGLQQTAAVVKSASPPSILPQHMILVPEDVTLGAQIGIGSFGVSHEHACVYLPRHADSQDDQYRHTISCCRRWSTKRSGMARKLPRKLPIRS